MASADPKANLFGIEFDAIDLETAIARARQAIEERRLLSFGVINAAKLVKMRSDPYLANAVLGCDVILADGASVVLASRLLRRRLPERVAGIDLFERLVAEGSERGWRIFFLGARQDVLERTLATFRERDPRLVVAGARDGYFSLEEEPAVADEIARSKADLLFLAMTSPKKELFLDRWQEQLGVPVLHGVGGSFDVVAGKVRRAPERWQRMGLEWAYRLVQEPRRMWRRYLVTNTLFLGLLLKELVRRTPPRTASPQRTKS